MSARHFYELIRAQLNRILIAISLVVLLPIVVLAERVKPGAGRSLAVHSIRSVAAICGVAFRVKMSPRIDPEAAYVFVANHSSPIDIAAVLVACPDIRFVAAAELFRIPLFAATMRALATIPIERREPEVARRQLAEFARSEGGSKPRVVIFPEGGIAPRGGRLPFKSGAFALAIETNASVVPVAIFNTGKVLPPRSYFAVRPGVISVLLMEPMATDGRTSEDRGALRDQVAGIINSALEAGDHPMGVQ